jgi:hypothetical protein
MRKVLCVSTVSACLTLSVSLGLRAQTLEQHELTVAANSSLHVSNAEVDTIIQEMNQIIAHKVYNWDQACPNITFKRKGDVQNVPTLALSGSYDELAQELHSKAPGANVMIVSVISCAGIDAAGCGTIGQEPSIVGQFPGYDAQLWLHERGHAMGLAHSAEGGEDSAYPPNISMRFMFWQLGVGHTGKIAPECASFATSRFASTTAIPAPPSQVAAAPPAPIAPQAPDLAAMASAAHLTVAAFKIVGAPWVDRMPIDAISRLAPADLESVRDLLRGPPNQYWSQAMNTLAIAGNASDVGLIQRALTFPLAAVAPGHASPAVISQARNLLRIKLSAPSALGILAGRTKSDSAVDTLWATANLETSSKAVGNAGAVATTSLSKSAIGGLSVVSTPKAQQYLNAVLDSQAAAQQRPTNSGSAHAPVQTEPVIVPAPPGSQSKSSTVAPLSAPEQERLKTNSKAVKEKGIEAYIRGDSTRG